MAPKSYAIKYISGKGEVKTKWHCKGISKFSTIEETNEVLDYEAFIKIYKQQQQKIKVHLGNKPQTIKLPKSKQDQRCMTIGNEDIVRSLFKSEWRGREAYNNTEYSVPHGYLLL